MACEFPERCTYSRKNKEGPKLSPLTDLQALQKREIKAKAEL